MVKYYSIRILAAFLVLGSFRFGFLAYAEYGKWVGWITFIILVSSGIFLDKVAEKFRKTK
jgi:hypothetical protein